MIEESAQVHDKQQWERPRLVEMDSTETRGGAFAARNETYHTDGSQNGTIS